MYLSFTVCPAAGNQVTNAQYTTIWVTFAKDVTINKRTQTQDTDSEFEWIRNFCCCLLGGFEVRFMAGEGGGLSRAGEAGLSCDEGWVVIDLQAGRWGLLPTQHKSRSSRVNISKWPVKVSYWTDVKQQPGDEWMTSQVVDWLVDEGMQVCRLISWEKPTTQTQREGDRGA